MSGGAVWRTSLPLDRVAFVLSAWERAHFLAAELQYVDSLFVSITVWFTEVGREPVVLLVTTERLIVHMLGPDTWLQREIEDRKLFDVDSDYYAEAVKGFGDWRAAEKARMPIPPLSAVGVES